MFPNLFYTLTISGFSFKNFFRNELFEHVNVGAPLEMKKKFKKLFDLYFFNNLKYFQKLIILGKTFNLSYKKFFWCKGFTYFSNVIRKNSKFKIMSYFNKKSW